MRNRHESSRPEYALPIRSHERGIKCTFVSRPHLGHRGICSKSYAKPLTKNPRQTASASWRPARRSEIFALRRPHRGDRRRLAPGAFVAQNRIVRLPQCPPSQRLLARQTAGVDVERTLPAKAADVAVGREAGLYGPQGEGKDSGPFETSGRKLSQRRGENGRDSSPGDSSTAWSAPAFVVMKRLRRSRATT
jgi:hypothetical protein